MLLKWQVKKLRDLLIYWHEEESLWNILSDNYNIRQEKEENVGRISEKLKMTSN